MGLWYARMGDIPGIRFGGSPGVDRARLADAHVRPSIRYGHLVWPSPPGEPVASPVHRRAYGGLSSLDYGDLLRWVWEGLELPGEPADYHFLLQGAVEELWSRRRAHPEGLPFVEVFAYADLALIEAAPESVAVDEAPSRGFLHIATLDRLLTVLEREGALWEALALSRRAQRFGDHYRRESLEAKAAALDEERR